MANPNPKPNPRGRPKGSKNKMTIAIKDVIRQALEEVGGKDYLVGVAHTNPSIFCNLVARCIPHDPKGNEEGAAPLTLNFTVAEAVKEVKVTRGK